MDVNKILSVLKTRYELPEIALDHTDTFQLLIAVVLSAQTKDTRVNMVTPELFEKYPTAEKLANASVSDVERIIHSLGFFQTKAKNIVQASKDIVYKYNGQIPTTMEGLTALAGVGRKTANVMLSNAFNIPRVVVDTHVKRLSYRMGLSNNTDPVKVEEDLMKIIPKEEWRDFSHRIIFLGREICDARKPKCTECPLQDDCPKRGIK